MGLPEMSFLQTVQIVVEEKTNGFYLIVTDVLSGLIENEVQRSVVAFEHTGHLTASCELHVDGLVHQTLHVVQDILFVFAAPATSCAPCTATTTTTTGHRVCCWCVPPVEEIRREKPPRLSVVFCGHFV